MISPDLFPSAARTRLLSQLGFTTSLAESMLESVEKIVGLNMQAAKAGLDVSISSTQQLMSTKDPQDFVNASSAQLQPHSDIVLTYLRHLASIASGTQRQLARITQDQVSESSREIATLLDEMGSDAPESSRGSISLLRSALDNATYGYNHLTKSTQSAIEQLESTLNEASHQMTTLTAKSNGRAKNNGKT
jgi:phasin family protein